MYVCMHVECVCVCCYARVDTVFITECSYRVNDMIAQLSSNEEQIAYSAGHTVGSYKLVVYRVRFAKLCREDFGHSID
jgi:hypothetical protein